jgi:uncharacterized protein (DUF427 family)
MAAAYWKDTLIVESDDIVVVEGNPYFPEDSLKRDFFRPSDYSTVCGWKGTASYFDVVVDDEVNESAAWYYAAPKAEVENIRGRVAFWKGIEVRS